jgi:hypothetical protein
MEMPELGLRALAAAGTDEHVDAWVEKYYPLVRAEDRSRYVDGLSRAGLGIAQTR